MANTFTVNGLTSSVDGSYINSAVVTVTIQDAGGIPVVGVSWPLTMTYVSGSNGNYTVSLPISLVAGTSYLALIAIAASGARAATSLSVPFVQQLASSSVSLKTSNTFTFAPSVGEVALQAYRRIGIPRTAIDQEKLTDARMEMNALFSDWANKGPNLWAVDQKTVTLVSGTATIPIDPSTVDILDAWISFAGQDRMLSSISRSDYAGYPQKTLTGVPTSFWYDKLSTSTITFWPVPDSNGPYIFNFYRLRQMQDAGLSGGQTPDIPYRWIDALIWGLAERLAFIHAPDKLPLVAPKAMQTYASAAAQDTEDAPLTFAPQMSGYFR